MGKKEEQQDTEMEVVDADEPMEEGSNNKWKYREDPGWREAYLEVMRLIEEEDRIEDEENAVAAAAAAAKPGRKRAHARKAGELNDVETTKQYKCNYWADPAYAKTMDDIGQLMARSVAVMHHGDREIAAIRARRGLAS